MIRFLFTLVCFLAIVWFATTVPVGRRTLWGHVSRVWSSSETQEMVDDVKKAAGPVVNRAKRAVEAGAKELDK